MTVAELMDELRRLPPTATVRLLISEVWGVARDKSGAYEINDENSMPLDETDAMDADHVSWQGNHVLVRSK